LPLVRPDVGAWLPEGPKGAKERTVLVSKLERAGVLVLYFWLVFAYKKLYCVFDSTREMRMAMFG